MVRLGAEAEAGHRVPRRRSHLEGFVGIMVGGAGAGGIEARHCSGRVGWRSTNLGAERGDGEGRSRGFRRFWGRVFGF